jgi:outer membrane protein TolC
VTSSLLTNLLWSALSIVLFLTSFGSAYAFSLAESYELALAKESQFQAARARELADRELSSQALAELFPRVSVTANRFEVKQQREDNGLELPRQQYPSEGAVLSLRQPIFNPRLFSQYRRAVALGLSGGAVLSAERQGLANRVASGFATLVLSYERKRLLEAQVRSGVARLDAANRAWKAGTGTKTDINEIQAQLDLLRAEMLHADQSILIAQADFARTTGVTLKAPLRFGVNGIDVSRLQLSSLESF